PLAELRPRGEYRHDLDRRDYGLLAERVRLGVDALRGPLEARVVLQDARELDLGASPDPLVGPGSLAFTGALEAWAEAGTDSMRPSFVRVGGQPVTGGEGRVLGEADGPPAGRSLAAVRARLSVRDWAFEALGAVLTEPQNGAAIDAYGELAG